VRNFDTYEELFDRFLRERITAGGKLGNVISAVLAYMEKDQGCRALLWQHWFYDFLFTCGRCGERFVGTDLNVPVEEENYVLCSKCART